MKLKYYQLIMLSKFSGMSIEEVKKITEGPTMDDVMQMLFYNNTNGNIKNKDITGGNKNDKGKIDSIIQRSRRERAPIYCGKNRNARFSKTRANR